VLIGAADVAVCGQGEENENDERTAEMVEQMLAGAPDAVVFIPGDVVYDSGSTAEYQNCFGPSWGRFKERVRPVPGNHDYNSGGAPYFDYFGAAAGEVGKGYYSYDLGDWHVVALNSNCNDIACGPNSPQVRWLEEDLRASTAKCSLAYWHHPRFTSGLAGDTGVMNPIWRTAVENGVDVVVSGHDHDYERFAPLDSAGQPDPNGARQFIVGTGGAYLRPFGEPKPASEVRLSGTHGIIRFNLYPDRYEWQFIPQDDPARTDSGTGECH
jgi:3',5'-cyclic AMP phosphodiesterase CpdA